MGDRLLVLVVVLLFGAAGCTGGPGRGAGVTDTVAMDAISAQIQHRLAERPDVATAIVVYQDNINAPAQVHISITVVPHSPVEPVADAATRMVWQSRLNPLRHIDVGVADIALSVGTRRVLDLPKDQDELVRSYGPRPTS